MSGAPAPPKPKFNFNLNLTKCGKCQKPIVGPLLKAAGSTWHEHCLKCTSCGGPLLAGYQVRDEGASKVPYCVECYSKSFLPTCGNCQKPIKDDAFVEALDKTFHNDCFVCATCSTNLAGGQQFWPVDGSPYCQKDFWAARMRAKKV